MYDIFFDKIYLFNIYMLIDIKESIIYGVVFDF